MRLAAAPVEVALVRPADRLLPRPGGLEPEEGLLDRRLDPVLAVEVGEDGHDRRPVRDAGRGDDVGLDPDLAEGTLPSSRTSSTWKTRPSALGDVGVEVMERHPPGAVGRSGSTG